jgi:polyhydroxyalkanoate synthase subunit PhaC
MYCSMKYGVPSIGRQIICGAAVTDLTVADPDSSAGTPSAVSVTSIVGLAKGVGRAVAQPGPLSRQVGQLAVNISSVLLGTEEFDPGPKDRRFTDPAWRENPVYRRWMQGYVALAESLGALVDDLEGTDTDWRDIERARFAVGVVSSGLSPTNFLPGNPAALKLAFDTLGRSVARGARNFVGDLRHNGGFPTQTDRSAFAVGTDLAITPGSVVYRSEVLELIHYTPSTDEVHERPLLVIPPPIGRYYFLDLRPGRSFVEYAVSRGQQVFMISWRNPTAEHRDWNIDTYASAARDCLAVIKEITGSDDVNSLGFCAGGILQTLLLNHLAATEDTSINSASYAVTLLDFHERAPLGAFSAARLLEVAGGRSERDGVLSAASLAAIFNLMRPDDLVFNYVVSNWLMGKDPPVFDILAWSVDGTNLPAALHRELLGIFQDNLMCRDGEMTVLGSPVRLKQINVPTFVTGAVTDHLTPWTGCYRTVRLLSGPTTFVLSNAGHIASLVNPPGNPKASYYEGGSIDGDAQEWLATATKHSGSWWEAWADWINERSGPLVAAPSRAGSDAYPPLSAAPGAYVRDEQP